MLRFFACILFAISIALDAASHEWLVVSIAGWLCFVTAFVVEAIKELPRAGQ